MSLEAGSTLGSRVSHPFERYDIAGFGASFSNFTFEIARHMEPFDFSPCFKKMVLGLVAIRSPGFVVTWVCIVFRRRRSS
jgi:hypothetical protein